MNIPLQHTAPLAPDNATEAFLKASDIGVITCAVLGPVITRPETMYNAIMAFFLWNRNYDI